MKNHLLITSLAALLLVACGGDPKTITKIKEVPADPCVIDGDELKCPDGSHAPLPKGGVCTVTSQEGGSFLLKCPDGSGGFTQAVIPADGCTASAGTGGAFLLHCGGMDFTVPGPATTEVDGTATLFGETDSSGISVSLEGTTHAATTDATGAFKIEGVPSGLYTVKATKAGWSEQSFPNVLVYGGKRELEIELRRAHLIQAANDAGLNVQQQSDQPTSAGALVLQIGSQSRVGVVRAGSPAVLWLENGFGGTAFSADGRFLASTGSLWDMVAGTKVATGDGVQEFWFSEDGSRIAYQTSGAGRFFVRNLASGAETSVNASIVGGRIFNHGADYYYPIFNGELWALKAGASNPQTVGSNLGQVATMTFTTADRAITSSTGVGATALDEIKLSTLAVNRIIPDVSLFSASADGARVAYVRDDTDLNARVVEIVDLPSGERRIADSTGTLTVHAVSADGRYIAYSRDANGVSDWFIYDWNAQNFWKLLDKSSGSAEFEGTGAHMLLQRGGDLVDYTVATKAERVIAAQAGLSTQRSPDGRYGIVSLDLPPRTALLDMQTLQLTDLGVQLSTPTFSSDSKALAGIGLGEAPTKLHVWTLPSMAHDTIAGGADVFQFSPSGAEIVMRQIEGGNDRLLVYRRDTKASVALDTGSIKILGVLTGEVIYVRKPGLGEDPPSTAGVWSAPLR
jgi:hypothetical protein